MEHDTGRPLEGAGAQGSGSGVTRRQALKRGAVVGGLLWSVPAMQVLGASAAHADSASGSTPPPPPPPPPPPQKLCTPSYGLVVLDCDGKIVVMKVDENGTVDSPGDSSSTGSPQELANAILKAAGKQIGSWTSSSSVTGGELSGGGLYLTWTSGCTLLGAATHDGSYGTGDNSFGLKNVGPASVSGNTATFSKPCKS